jgi:hypothetical protein
VRQHRADPAFIHVTARLGDCYVRAQRERTLIANQF